MHEFHFRATFNICEFKLTAVNLRKADILVSNIHFFLKSTFVLVMTRSIQEGDLLKKVGMFTRYSKLRVFEQLKHCTENKVFH